MKKRISLMLVMLMLLGMFGVMAAGAGAEAAGTDKPAAAKPIEEEVQAVTTGSWNNYYNYEWDANSGYLHLVKKPGHEGLLESTEAGNSSFISANAQKVITLKIDYPFWVDGFSGWKKLKTVTFYEGSDVFVEPSAFKGCSALTSFPWDECVSYGVSAFENCSSLSGIIELHTVSMVGYYAFKGCPNLTALKFYNAYTYINNPHGDAIYPVGDPATLTLYCYENSRIATQAQVGHRIISLGWYDYCEGGTNHRMIVDRYIQEPTCTTSGIAIYKCAGCGMEQEEVVEATGHFFDLTGVCTRCGYSSYDDPSDRDFVDVSMREWFYPDVHWAYKHNITAGTSKTEFSPNNTCTRGQIVTFLWRYAGEPEPMISHTNFTDVKAGAYYEKAVLWAVENGITAGTTETTFSPEAECTRGQICTFIWRYCGSVDMSEENDPNNYSDITTGYNDVQKGTYYYKAMLWMYMKHLINGTSDTTMEPNSPCTRAQAVAFLHRLYNFEKHGDPYYYLTDPED